MMQKNNEIYSLWHEETQLPERKPLRGDIRTDTLIIGGGLAGILTAYLLEKRGIHCVVLEAKRVGSGQSGNTTAKITLLHGLKYAHVRKVFGEAESLETMAAVSNANIDMVCQNVMMDADRWTMIDYEWTFFFPVPTAFLVYRVLHYYLETHGKRSVLDKEALYTWAGITKEQRETFHEMEHHFQQHLTSGHVPMREMYGAISPGTYQVRHLVTKEQIRRGQERMQIFFSDENGFREERSIYYKLENGEFHGTIEIPEHTDEIRLDPCDGMGLCQIEELSFDVGTIGEIITSDGITEDGEFYLMNVVDPQFYLGRVPEGAKTLTVHLHVTVTEADSVKINEAAGKLLKNRGKRLRKEKEKRKQAEAQLAEKAEELSRLQAELAQKTAKIEEMEQTKVWKLYRKYRTIRERN